MELTRDQSSLLLYLETRLVDHDGRVCGEHMNCSDSEQAKDWSDSGYIKYGRIASEDCTRSGSMWVTFSDEAWKDAHRERRARSERCLKNKGYRTTDEKRDAEFDDHGLTASELIGGES